MKRIIWTPIAIDSPEGTYEFINRLWSKQVAEAFLNQLDYRIDQIKINSKIAPCYNNSEFRKLIIHKTTSLFYKEYENSIKILLVWDNRQNPSELYQKISDS